MRPSTQRTTLWVLVVLLSVAPVGPAQAQDREDMKSPDIEWVLGTRAWVTTGYTTWNFAGASIKPLSELRWRGVDSVVPELDGELRWKRLVIIGAIAGGAVDDGVLIDDDFTLSGHQGRFSHTRSDVGGNRIEYASGDIGLRVLTLKPVGASPPGYLDYFIGYQYWHEQYVAFGANGILDLGPFGIPIVLNNTVPSGTKVDTQDYFWHSLRLGMRTQIPVDWGLSVKARAVLLPWTATEMDDVHHLRTNLLQNPSFRSEAEGGFGYQLDAGLSYTVWKQRLSIEAGYQYWGLDSGEGDKFTRAPGGTTMDKLLKISIERYGPYIGLQYRF